MVVRWMPGLLLTRSSRHGDYIHRLTTTTHDKFWFRGISSSRESKTRNVTRYVLGQNTKRYRAKTDQRRPNNATSEDILSRKVLVSIAFDEDWRESSGFGPAVSVIMYVSGWAFCFMRRGHVLSFNENRQRCPAKRSNATYQYQDRFWGAMERLLLYYSLGLCSFLRGPLPVEAELNDHVGDLETDVNR